MNKMITGIIGGLVVFILAAALVPTAITSITGTNTSSWSAGSVAIWTVLPIIFIVGILLGIVYMFIGKKH